jgi:ATP-binding cassette, subfamily B, bacterial
MKDSVNALRLMLGIMWETNRKIFMGHIFVNIAGILAALLLALGIRPLIDGTYYHRTGDIVLGGVLCLIAILVLIFSPVARRAFMARSIEVLIMVMQRRILTLTSKSPRVDHFERPEFWDRLQVLRRNFGELLMGMMGVFVTPIIIAQLVITSIVMFRLDARLIFLPLVTVPLVWLSGRAQRLQQKSEEAVSSMRRSVSEMFRLATSAQAGKELRVYGLAPELVARHGALATKVTSIKEKALARAVGLRLIGFVLLAVAYTAAVYIVIRAAATGQHSPGDVALTLTLAGVLIGAATVSSEFSSLIARAVAVAKSYEQTMHDLSLGHSANGGRPGVQPPRQTSTGFTLEGVGFSYAGSERFAISDVNVHLPAGSVVALVGENGAGKTTLVKLLSRMYPPTGGRILLDGKDITDFAIDRYRRRLSASFQDFVRFELPVKENVGIGDLDRMDDEAMLRTALAKARCEFVDELPKQWDTQLGKEWEGGVELSGGQWQKLALARSMMRDEALLVIFDEPTAALDPQSEYAIFQQVADEARAAESLGRVTLLVSHRFSTVRMADLILVLDKGRLIEHGTHEQLMTNDGLYAELYRLQAKAYVS